MKGVYNDYPTRRLCNEPPKKIGMVRYMAVKLLTNEEEVRQRWKGHFVEASNRLNPEQAAEVLSEVEMIEEIPSGPITKAEIRSSVTGISAGNAWSSS